MSKNKTLSTAKSAKNDEFYTQYADIQKKLISTSYAAASKKIFVATKDTKKHKGEGGLCDLCDLCG